MNRTYQHFIAAVVGLVILMALYAPSIIQGDNPRAPDAAASHDLTRMSQDWEQQHGKFPSWTPAIFSGMPSHGSMIYTPTNPMEVFMKWLAMDNFGIRLLEFWAIAAISVYVLLIRYRLAPLAAFFGAMIYVLTPYIPGILAAGHNNKVWAMALAPLLILVADELIRHRSLRAVLCLSLALAWHLWVRHPQVTYYALMLIGYIVLADAFVLKDVWRRKVWRLTKSVLLFSAGGLLAAGMVAETYLPMMMYQPHSMRGDNGIGLSDHSYTASNGLVVGALVARDGGVIRAWAEGRPDKTLAAQALNEVLGFVNGSVVCAEDLDDWGDRSGKPNTEIVRWPTVTHFGGGT